MKLTILGNGSGGAFQGRNYTAQMLQIGNQNYLIDCGEGTQHQAWRLRLPLDKVRQIFISHLHGDHVFGLIGLLTSFALKSRATALEIFAPAGLRDLIDVHHRICGVRIEYPLTMHEVETEVSKIIFETEKIEVWTVPLHHRQPTTGYFFKEKPKPRHILPEKIEQYQIPIPKIKEVKNGADLALPDGRIVPNSELTTPTAPPKSFAFCSDTAFHPPVADCVRGADLLYHEATFLEAQREYATISFHSTAGDAAEIARRAEAKRLILGHFSSRYDDLAGHLAEARAVFPNSEVALEGATFEI